MAAVRPRISAVLFDVGGTLVREPDVDAWVERARFLCLNVDPYGLARAYVETLSEVDKVGALRDAETLSIEFWRRVMSRTLESRFPPSPTPKRGSRHPLGGSPSLRSGRAYPTTAAKPTNGSRSVDSVNFGDA
ncbi:MAG TPA: hypothetical protein VEG66_06945 [Thermoplasmata archaeon]|nr:hypothetical protein [Thermoplasmata archaeon]